MSTVYPRYVVSAENQDGTGSSDFSPGLLCACGRPRSGAVVEIGDSERCAGGRDDRRRFMRQILSQNERSTDVQRASRRCVGGNARANDDDVVAVALTQFRKVDNAG